MMGLSQEVLLKRGDFQKLSGRHWLADFTLKKVKSMVVTG